MTFSVIIPTKNEEENIANLLGDIKNQTLQPAEVIVADAKSTDRTREVAESFGARVVDGGMPGPGRNAGAKAAIGEVLIFMDADARLIHDDFFELAMAEIVERGAECGTCDLVAQEATWLEQFGHIVYNWIVRRSEKGRPIAPGTFIFCRRGLHDEVRGFDEEVIFAEDQDYVSRAGKKGIFAQLRRPKIGASVRRLRRDGKVATLWKYLYCWAHIILKGPMKKTPFEYSFDYAEYKKRRK